MSDSIRSDSGKTGVAVGAYGKLNGERHVNGVDTIGQRPTPVPAKDVGYTYDTLQEIVDYLLTRTHHRPTVGIICGSGLGCLAERLTDPDSFDYGTIPHFPVSTVAGHVGRLVFGRLQGVPVVCMQGRFHYYEGYSVAKCSMPVRVMRLAGCTHLIATNAAGTTNPAFKVGDIMLIKDHINLMGFAGNSPLLGPNDDRLGPRFVGMGRSYDPRLLQAAKTFGRQMQIETALREGVYCCVGGPNFETVAEGRYLAQIGVDAIGMSTVHEVITARHCGLVCFAFSLITNRCTMSYDEEENHCHEDFVGVGKDLEDRLVELVTRMVQHMHCDGRKEL